MALLLTVALCYEIFYFSPLFDETLRHIQLCNSGISQIKRNPPKLFLTLYLEASESQGSRRQVHLFDDEADLIQHQLVQVSCLTLEEENQNGGTDHNTCSDQLSHSRRRKPKRSVQIITRVQVSCLTLLQKMKTKKVSTDHKTCSGQLFHSRRRKPKRSVQIKILLQEMVQSKQG